SAGAVAVRIAERVARGRRVDRAALRVELECMLVGLRRAATLAGEEAREPAPAAVLVLAAEARERRGAVVVFVIVLGVDEVLRGFVAGLAVRALARTLERGLCGGEILRGADAVVDAIGVAAAPAELAGLARLLVVLRRDRLLRRHSVTEAVELGERPAVARIEIAAPFRELQRVREILL